jgi:hypothetical protein
MVLEIVKLTLLVFSHNESELSVDLIIDKNQNLFTFKQPKNQPQDDPNFSKF